MLAVLFPVIMSKFLTNTEIEKLLNETFEDSGSEGDVFESENSDIASDSDSGTKPTHFSIIIPLFLHYSA